MLVIARRAVFVCVSLLPSLFSDMDLIIIRTEARDGKGQELRARSQDAKERRRCRGSGIALPANDRHGWLEATWPIESQYTPPPPPSVGHPPGTIPSASARDQKDICTNVNSVGMPDVFIYCGEGRRDTSGIRMRADRSQLILLSETCGAHEKGYSGCILTGQ